VISK
ncbi:unnamed protein product, partial [Allacma fusca]|jgi:hypothetical protein